MFHQLNFFLQLQLYIIAYQQRHRPYSGSAAVSQLHASLQRTVDSRHMVVFRTLTTSLVRHRGRCTLKTVEFVTTTKTTTRRVIASIAIISRSSHFGCVDFN